jgi:multicomponent Na+:H+ antiporter subunit E
MEGRGVPFPRLRKRVVYLLALLVFWLLLSPGLDGATVLTGLATSLLVTGMLWKPLGCDHYLPEFDRGLWYRLWSAALFVPVFVSSVLASALTVARHAVRSPPTFTPGFVTFRSSLGRRFALIMLANYVTLTPGTLTVDIADNGTDLIIHCLDADAEAVKAEVTRMQVWIERIFG